MPIIFNIKLATCGIPSVPKTSSDAQVCLTEGHDSKSFSQDQSCTAVESTSVKEAASGSCDTITNSATTLKLTHVDASSTGGHDSELSTLASSDNSTSTSQGLPTLKVLHIHYPASSHTKSNVKQQQSDQDLGNDSTTLLPSNPKFSVSNARPPSVEPRKLKLVLPVSLQGVTQHHLDFVRCDDIVSYSQYSEGVDAAAGVRASEARMQSRAKLE